jgi:ubiquinone/menaquinone biosynthesis C-methylase UbiE
MARPSLPPPLRISVADKAALEVEKKKLFELLRLTDPKEDPVLADPLSKQPLYVVTETNVLGSNIAGRGVKYLLKSSSNTFTGSSDSFINLLEPVKNDGFGNKNTETTTKTLATSLLPLVPPPLRSSLRALGLPVGEEFVPMRDLFTSPTVSFAYERGWRQGFRQAGFPGPDKEAAMAMEYFEPAMVNCPDRVLVDMSCATGLFTRRFAASGKYKHVLGCDYSESMLTEARRRIESDRELRDLGRTRLDLVRMDVGRIAMKDESVSAFHAGAAMHCWPQLEQAASEIYRVLKPGGRYFATTFLSSYFGTLQQVDSGIATPQQTFQYFQSTEELRSIMESGGFDRQKILIEVLGSACAVIRCEK